MYNYKDIIQLHLEISSLCNAECSVCNRRIQGGPKNPIMIERFTTLDEFKQWLSVDFLKQLEQLTLCGNYGDPMTNPELVPILQYVRELNPTISITMHTNAGGRDSQFWKDLSKIIGNNGCVVFSVDGLEDTNHLYRKGTNWGKIMDAMVSFTSTKKCRAEWEFLVFKHNQHQLEEAKQLAESMGITFVPKEANGFTKNIHRGSGHHKPQESITVLNVDGTKGYKIYPPNSEQKNEDSEDSMFLDWAKISEEDVRNIFSRTDENLFDFKMGKMGKEKISQLDKCEINCMVLDIIENNIYNETKQSIFIDANGLVFPCCFTAGKYYASNSYENVQFAKFIESYGEDSIDLKKEKSIKVILESDLMKHGYANSWKKTSIQEGKLHVCSMFCGN